MRIIFTVVLVITATAVTLPQQKTKEVIQRTQVARGTTEMQKQAKCTFDIKAWDEKSYNETEGGPKLTRATVTKLYHGDIEGQGELEYLMMYHASGSATFVGFERVTGSIGGHTGSFVLQHTGTFEGGVANVILSVVPDSGTGSLRGIKGDGGFNVGHQPPYTMTLNYVVE